MRWRAPYGGIGRRPGGKRLLKKILVLSVGYEILVIK